MTILLSPSIHPKDASLSSFTRTSELSKFYNNLHANYARVDSAVNTMTNEQLRRYSLDS